MIRWNAEALWEALLPQLPGFTVELLAQVDSTNSELMRRARAGQSAPTLLLAERQHSGRGRLGRSWDSGEQAGAALTFSLGLTLAPRDWAGLSLAVGLALVQALDPQDRGGLRLKWPNDIWLADDRKLAGILVETASLAPAHAGLPGERYVVVGVGLNIAAPAADAAATRAGLQQCLPGLDAPAALALLLPPLVQTLLQFAHDGFAPLAPHFAQRDVLRGRMVRLSDGTEGLALGVDAQGAFLVQTPAGVQQVISNEISVRPHVPRG